jgi:hypothetical protein
MISVLCVAKESNYHLIPGLDLWQAARDAYNFSGSNPVITHAPCAQWSRMKAFSRYDKKQKDLAFFCFNKVIENGGIFEHPAGSSFFNEVQCNRNNLYSFDQSWWQFPARKRTYLYFSKCKPLAFPLSFDCPLLWLDEISPRFRSIMPLSFCQYLVNCCAPLLVYHNSQKAPILK